MSVLGDIDAPHTYGFVSDVAQGLVTLARHDDALAEVWHIPAAPTLTRRELMTVAFEVADRPPRIRDSKISAHVVRVIGRFQRDVGELSEMLYQFEKPFVVSHAKFESAFGADPTPHDIALNQTLDW